MTVYLFHCTNGSGFPGTAGTTIHVRYDFAATSRRNAELWGSGRSKWSCTADGRPVAGLLLRSASDAFDTIPVNTYISGMVIHRPRPNVQTAGWRWLLFSRMN